MKKKNRLTLLLSLIFSKLLWTKVARSTKEKREFRDVWYEIWLEEGYALPEDQIVGKYGKYDSVSTDLLMKLIGVIPVGTLRIIQDSPLGLPVFNDFEIRRNPEERVVEITLFTVRKRFRSLAPLMLMREMYGHVRNQYGGIVMAADRRLFFLLKRGLSFPLHQIGPEKHYEGSITYPSYLNFRETLEALRRKSPSLYKFFKG